MNAPIAVFAYNRSDKLKNCLACLEKCREAPDSELFIFCDGSKGDKDRDSVAKVQEYADEYSCQGSFKSVSVIKQSENRGLARSIIAGVTEVVNRFGRVIVVEDDLRVLPSFLTYLNEGLEYYQDDDRIGSVCAFSYPLKELNDYEKDVYALLKADSWGWATWADRWNNAVWADTDFNTYLNDRKLRWKFEKLEAGFDRLMYLQSKGRIDSWAIRWVYYLFTQGKLSVYPTKSQAINDGFDGTGTHCADGFGKGFNASEDGSSSGFKWEKCELNERIAKACAKFPRRRLIFYIPETLIYMYLKR